jgi:hypothetical protein
MAAVPRVTSGEHPARPRVRCSRCGYDLRGATSEWQDACPLDGTCPECGLAFEWREIFVERIPPWCVEGGAGRIVPLRRVAATFVRTYWPWAFWSSLSLAGPIRWRRIVAYWIVIAAGLYAAAGGLAAREAWRYDRNRSQALMSAGLPALALDLRPVAYAFAAPISPVALNDPMDGRGAPASVPMFLPSRPSPLRAIEHSAGVAAQAALWFLAMHGCAAIAFAALPVSRRRAKVRFAHVTRVAAYGAALVVAPAVLLAAARWADEAWFGGPSALALIIPQAAATLAWIALPFLDLAWWSVATKRYLRMPHAWGVGLAVVIIGMLAPITIAFVVTTTFR